MPETSLYLYVTGRTSSRSERAIATVQEVASRAAGCHLEVVDVAVDPQAAEDARVMVTPTLDVETPISTQRIVGELEDVASTAERLGLLLDDAAPGTHVSGDQSASGAVGTPRRRVPPGD